MKRRKIYRWRTWGPWSQQSYLSINRWVRRKFYSPRSSSAPATRTLGESRIRCPNSETTSTARKTWSASANSCPIWSESKTIYCLKWCFLPISKTSLTRKKLPDSLHPSLSFPTIWFSICKFSQPNIIHLINFCLFFSIIVMILTSKSILPTRSPYCLSQLNWLTFRA